MSTAIMPKFLAPVFVEKPMKLQVESTFEDDEDFDLSPEAWAAFDRLCDYYGIHTKPTLRLKKSPRVA